MDATQAAWTGSGGPSAPSSTNPLLVPVPQDLLDSDQTTVDTLKEYCRQRAIVFRERPSKQVLRSRLTTFNADTQTIWTARITSLSALVGGQLQVSRGALAPFQAAIWHPSDVPVDGAPYRDESENIGHPPSDMGQQLWAGAAGRPPPLPSRPPSPRPPPRPPPSPFQRRRTSRGHSPANLPSGVVPLAEPTAPLPTLLGGSILGSDGRPDSVANAGSVVMKESDRKYLEYVAARRKEEAEEAEERHRVRHDEVRGMMLALGEKMVGVAGAIQAQAQSATAAAARHSEGMVSLTQENVALRAVVVEAGPSPEVRREGKRARTVGEQMHVDAGGRDLQSGGTRADPDLRRDILFSSIMEPELMTARMRSQPLMDQLEWMVQMAHVSAEKPGLFGSYVIKSIYDRASKAAGDDLAEGIAVPTFNKEKKERLANIISNKADTYARQLYWLNAIVPRVLSTPAVKTTAEEMSVFKLEPSERVKVLDAIKEVAVKLQYSTDHPMLKPASARMNMLRDMLCTMATRYGRDSNVDKMLLTPVFAARLEEASKRIAPRFHAPAPTPAT